MARIESGQNWTCPHCNRPQTLTTAQVARETHPFLYSAISKHGAARVHLVGVACANPECCELTMFAKLDAGALVEQGQRRITEPIVKLADLRLRPRSNAIQWPEYIPAQIREDYEEACLIVELSPKAAATLARRCLQGMIRDFCKIAKTTLDAEIKELRKVVDEGRAPRGVAEETIDAIDAVRAVGNIGAHMEKDVNTVIAVEPGEAKILISLIEQLLDEWYVDRNKREKRLAEVKALGAQKRAQRDIPKSADEGGGETEKGD